MYVFDTNTSTINALEKHTIAEDNSFGATLLHALVCQRITCPFDEYCISLCFCFAFHLTTGKVASIAYLTTGKSVSIYCCCCSYRTTPGNVVAIDIVW